MHIHQLVNSWEKSAKGKLTATEYRIRLPLEDAARIAALAEMYPRRNTEQILQDLLKAALDELEGGLPYVKGDTVVAYDEENDPIYEDVGLTPRFLQLAKKHLQELESRG